MKKKFSRINAFVIIIIIIFALLVGKLAYLQVIAGDDYRNIADNMAEKPVTEIAPRGEILDRNKNKLATNVLSYNVAYSVQNNNGKKSSKEINDTKNTSIANIVKILYKDGCSDKINVQSIPIDVDATKGSFSFNYKGSDDFINKAIYSFEVGNKIIKADKDLDKAKDKDKAGIYKKAIVDAKTAFYKLCGSDKYDLVDKDSSGNYKPKYDLTLDELHKVVALRLAIESVGYSQYKEVYIANNIKKETFYNIKVNSSDYPGISCEIAPLRYYPNGEVGSNFLGYLGKISNADKYKNLGYDVNRELIGMTGLEGALENNTDLNIKLRGEPGTTWYKVDNLGRIIKETAKLDPVPGDTVVTTIDLNIQKAAEKSFDDTMSKIQSGGLGSDRSANANRGGLVVMDVDTGEIIAMVSRPGFDPNLFAESGSVKDPNILNQLFYPNLVNQDKLKSLPVVKNQIAKLEQQINNEKDAAKKAELQNKLNQPVEDSYDVLPKPLLNYATCGTAPPGSTFKPLTSIAALQDGKITKNTMITDEGIYTKVPGFRGKCWLFDEYGITHGTINVEGALAGSCNYFFFEVGRLLGYSSIGNWAYKFGVGYNPQTGELPKSGIEIEEQAGSVGSQIGFKIRNIDSRMSTIVKNLADKKYGGYDIVKGTKEYLAIKSVLMDGLSKFNESKLTDVDIKNEKAISYIKQMTATFDADSSRPGDPLNTAIGQGDTQLTPLQMAQYLATLVNGGTRYKAHLVKQVLNPDGSVKKNIQPEVLNKLDLNADNVETVKEGMKKVNEEGTGAGVFDDYPIATGGKTGSAQWSSEGEQDYGRNAYGWFIGFAPYDKPKIAVAVVIYDGVHGIYAANVVKAVYDAYFGLNK